MVRDADTGRISITERIKNEEMAVDCGNMCIASANARGPM